MEILDKVVIIDPTIIDNTIYTIIEKSTNYNTTNTFYVIDGFKKVTMCESQIRLASKTEIENDIKFDPIQVKTVVTYIDLLKPDFLLEIIEFNQITLQVTARQNYTKELYTGHIEEFRPARQSECEIGVRLPIYNRDMYLSYLNPFMIYDLYNHNNAEHDMIYYDYLFGLELIYHNRQLTENGERLYNDLDFEYLTTNLYIQDQIDDRTNYIATDADGTVTEFKTNNIEPTFDEITGKWFIIELNGSEVISINKVTGMMPANKYQLSLREI